MPAQKPLPTVTGCDGCGVCCLHMGYPTYIGMSGETPAERHWLSMPADLKAELLAQVAIYPAPPSGQLDGPCVWLDLETRRCRHHEHRPQVCRDFELGSQGCLDWRDVYRDRLQ